MDKILTLVLIFTGVFFTVQAQVPNPADIMHMAVYKASVGITDSIPDNLVNYNINSPAIINGMMTGIESDTLRECNSYDAKNNAYLYVKFQNGSRKVYHVFMNWMHFANKSDRESCFYITPSSQALFKSNAQ